MRPPTMAHRLTLICCLGLTLASLPSSVLAQAVEAPKKKEAASPVQDLIKKAIRAGNEQKFSESVQYLDQALQQQPKDRDALGLMALVAGLAADQAKDVPSKIASLRQAKAAYDRLVKAYQPLMEDEVKLGDSIKLDSARIAVLEGKPEQALDLLTKLVAGGYPRSVLIEMLPDFEPVRKLPAYEPQMTAAFRSVVKTELAAFKSFPFDFELKTVDGKLVKLADSKGKVTLVDVWGTWCPPCREEIPHLVDLAKKYAQDLKIVGINCNEEGSPAEVKQTITKFIADHQIPYPCVVNDETIQSKIPDFEGYPTLVILDRSGKVRLALVGFQPTARLEAILQTLMAESAP